MFSESDKAQPVHPWFALQVKPNAEWSVSAALRAKGFEEFLPAYRTRRKWSDRWKELELPLFAGYVFCRFDPQNRLPVLVTPGVSGVVGCGKVPQPVENHEIDDLRAVILSGLSARPWPYLRIGDRVRLQDGPLTGVEGILLDVKQNRKLVLSVSLLQRSVAVEVEDCWITPVWQKAAAG
jgi:transcription antitermination factor NusG